MKEFDPAQMPPPSSRSPTGCGRSRIGMRRRRRCISSAIAPPSSAPRRTSRSSSADGEMSPVAVHGGGILCAASDGKRIVMGGDDGKVVALDAKGESHGARDRRQSGAGSTMSRCIPTARWRGRPARPLSSRSGKGEEKSLRCALDRRRAGVRAEGPAARDRALQRRDAVVSQHGGQAGISGMGRLASRRHLQPGQQVSGHRDARAGAAWLAARRQPGTCA